MNERFVAARMLKLDAEEAVIINRKLVPLLQEEILDRIACRRIQFLHMLDYPDCSVALDLENSQ